MKNKQIVNTILECGDILHVEIESNAIHTIDLLERDYTSDELHEFIRDLVEVGTKANIILMEKHLPAKAFREFMDGFTSPILVFARQGGTLWPVVIHKVKRKYVLTWIGEEGNRTETLDSIGELDLACTDNLQVIFLSIFDYQGLVSDQDTDGHPVKMSPMKRLFHLLAAERRDIFYVYIYAAIVGLLGLSLPLGIQAAVELISGGVMFSSVYVLIAFVILGVMGTGALQVLQITIVEYLQQRLFTKAAFEFAFRVPRIKMESVLNLHMPELMNRFFDVLTLQKGLPKLLIDLSTGIIQIFFGLILLSFYHPFFVFFGLGLVSLLVGIFYITGPKGLQSAIVESKYKYKVVYWLEEIARTLYSFKLSGNTRLPIKKTDYFVNNYLKNRRTHFKVLIIQYSYVLLFKAIVTGGLLIIGTILVVQREITLGQFVASEVIIILILGSVEKIIMYTDVVYDMLTAVDKISHVTDLPLEQTGGMDIPKTKLLEKGLSVEIKKVNYKYPGAKHNSLNDINMMIESGQRVCIAGGGDSGKTTLTNIIAGIHTEYDGIITYNKYNLRDLDRTSLRDHIGKNVSQEDLFEGTILENILVGKPFGSLDAAIAAIEKVGLTDEIYSLPEGLNTEILSGGKGFSHTFANKLILARCLAKRPKLLILNDFFISFQKYERLKFIEMLTNPDNKWTLIVVSNDPLIMSAMDRVIYLHNGSILADAPFAELIKNDDVIKNIY